MKQKLTIIFIGVILLATFGCAGLRKDLIEISESDVKNAETTKIVARNLLSNWEINSGFIHGVFGDNIQEMPATIVEALNQLDALALKYKNNEITDWDLGYSVGLRVRILSAIVLQAIEQYAPQVLKYLPSLFSF